MKEQILNSNNSESLVRQNEPAMQENAAESRNSQEPAQTGSCKNGVCLVSWKPSRPAAA